VCLTHPHDDHYAGLGRLLKAYEGRVGRVWTVTHATSRYAEALEEDLASGREKVAARTREGLAFEKSFTEVTATLMAHLKVVHLGYHTDVMAERGKVDRNLRLTRMMFEADPTPKNSLEYARSIKLAGGDRHESSRLMAGILAAFEEHQYSVENNRGFLAFVLTSLAEDALAREVEAWSRAGETETARVQALIYSQRYPQGRRVHAVRRFGGLLSLVVTRPHSW